MLSIQCISSISFLEAEHGALEISQEEQSHKGNDKTSISKSNQLVNDHGLELSHETHKTPCWGSDVWKLYWRIFYDNELNLRLVI